MNLFRHRPLFLWCTAFMGAAMVGFSVQGWVKILLVGVLSLVLFAGLTLCLLGKIDRRRLATAAVTLLVGIGALAESYIYFNVRLDAAETLVGETHTFEAVVTDIGDCGTHMSNYTVHLTGVDGRAANLYAPLTCYHASDMHLGDQIRLTAFVVSLEQAGGGRRQQYALLGEGYAFGLEVYDENDYTVTDVGTGGFTLAMARHRETLSARMEVVFGEAAAGLPAALLIGERAYIPAEVSRDFSRTGVSHILSISGMHMTLLFGMLAVCLGRLGLHPKMRAVLLGVLALGYLAYLGFPPSATRSVVMLGGTYLAHLCAARADTLTSLGVAGVLILLFSPASVADVGFWMSFSSAFGLVTLMTLWRHTDCAVGGATEKSKTSPRQRLVARLKGLGRRGMVAFLAGVVAMTTSLWVTVGVMGEISPLSPIVTVLLTPLTGFVLLATPVALWMTGTVCGGWVVKAVNGACTLMTMVTEYLADVPWAVVSVSSTAVWVVIVAMTVALLLLLMVRLPKRQLVFMPVMMGWLLIGVMGGILGEWEREGLTVDYLQPSSTSEMLVVTQGQEAMICDFSDGTFNAMSDAIRQAKADGATAIDALVLTHYHNRMAGTLERLLAGEMVRALWLPAPLNENEYYMMRSCAHKAELYGVAVTVYASGQDMTVFSRGVLRIERTTVSRSARPVCLLTLTASRDENAASFVFCGGAVFESDLSSWAMRAASKGEKVLFGTHGPLVKEIPADLSRSTATWMGVADRETAAWMPQEYLPFAVTSLHIGEVRLTLPQ